MPILHLRFNKSNFQSLSQGICIKAGPCIESQVPGQQRGAFASRDICSSLKAVKEMIVSPAGYVS